MGENVNVVGAKHSGRYFWVKILTLLPECFALGDIYGRSRERGKMSDRVINPIE
ncbi:hypothetical protein [Planktothricoides sp. SR001]|uniref:hypothetical protein n=1 Tax=Planktothricoides sp. SR001 TaxID=1705388 RepID=UPI0012E10A83|nr:hypothetical protein [Planktothricoides sp. SR001]